jgi:hypothetical protein
MIHEHKQQNILLYNLKLCKIYISILQSKDKHIVRQYTTMNIPLPYTAISLSVIGRLIFMFLLYRNRSTNSLSLLFCLLNICSSSMWIYYSVQTNDIPMISRSSTEITLLFISAMYIIRNKIVDKQVLPS